MEKRERFGSRLGFILVSAGCAVGLGNVWKFPYMCGQYGGAFFILVYLVFLAILGLPVMMSEFAVGRGSQKAGTASYRALEKSGTSWHRLGWLGILGCYILMMFYTMVGGWTLNYVFMMLVGRFENVTSEQVGTIFDGMLADPWMMLLFTVITVVLSFGVCMLGMKKGVERINKIMMMALLILLAVLAVRSVTLPGAGEGIAFYLIPDFSKIAECGLGNIVFGAMSQAFFTLSLGIGSMAIFGSYLDKKRSIPGEAVHICLLDTLVALLSGFIVIPACFAFGIEPDAGPGLVFVTLPRIFSDMAGGRIWGTLFFVCLAFAALSTVIAVFENIIAFWMDMRGWSRRRAAVVNIVAISALSVPCVLGFNVWSGFAPLGAGSNIMDLEDFVVSYNLLPLGGLVYILFCVKENGWGFDSFLAEVNAGTGLKLSARLRPYLKYVLPFVILCVYIGGYYDTLAKKETGVIVTWVAFAVLLLSFILYTAYQRPKKS